MAPLDISYTTFYPSAIVTIALYVVPFSSYFTLNNIVTMKSESEVIQTGTIRKLGCGFLFAFHSDYGSILHRLRDKARYWSKNHDFFIPPCIRRPRSGGSRRNVAIPFGMEKLEWWG